MIDRHDVVIVGAGNAGISLAARLRKLGCHDVVLIAPGELHRYRPLLNYVAGGQATMRSLTRPTRQVVPPGCRWLRDTAVSIDTRHEQVLLASGTRVAYHDLVLAPGLEPGLDAVPGLSTAIATGWCSTAHLTDDAERTWSAITATRTGTVVFSIPPEPAPCGGTALKPLFSACDYWRQHGVLRDLDVHLVTPYHGILDIPFAESRLRDQLDRYGVRVHHQKTVSAVDHEHQTLTLQGADGETERITGIERAFIVPPYTTAGWLEPLTNAGGLIDVDRHTLAHRSHRSIWSLGDAAAVDTRPSGGALRRQVDILAENIVRSRRAEPLRTYDGYTVIPITTDRRRLMLLEFDRDLHPQPTVRWPDLTRPRRSLWFFDRYLEPMIYFRALLRGRV
ncbi:NAD(P)/FAD-dependent oxidoreductase [Cumulibacter manganitolerans]|uniref:NAD(P)/FAD-dependent oxidoreductase n=1 Tax=Cumulibacter manganitolerans TaxID=1884992 RepID=UPI001E3F0066|nr:FAD/NAD(P)-binding oxidoreductase [Cumulibacter manganitolerans]